ncbi:DUF2971 domain-containing protein [Paenibacillus sp. GCM10027626]|uniref:DUF2971 domain-containing protein n=1 Tax=Paenibacillus sp. GCM10027626 TaxID=3273411 RepID=UPI00363501CB
MAYTNEEWSKRIKYRSDISGYLYHLTKPVKDDNGKTIMSSLDVLLKILKERTILGSTTEKGFITGKRSAACFQDTPIYSLTQNIVHERAHKEELGGKVRYVGVGLAFPKPYVFQKGGRPVIYEMKEVSKKLLPEDEWWRIVDFNLMDKNHIVDWSHEREWRVPGNFNFDLPKAIVILPNPKLHNRFLEKLDNNDLLQLRGIVQTEALIY